MARHCSKRFRYKHLFRPTILEVDIIVMISILQRRKLKLSEFSNIPRVTQLRVGSSACALTEFEIGTGLQICFPCQF